MSTEESFMDFKCPYCGQVVSFPFDAAGHLETCINCLRSILVPQPGTEVGGILPLPITTTRLILRRFKTEDLEQLTSLLSEETFLDHMDGLADAEEESVLQWLGREQQVQLAAPDQTFHLAIQLQDGGGIVGCLGLRLMADWQAKLDANLHRNFQRQGFATEAVDGLLGFCFQGIKLHRVVASCDSGNTAACRLLENVGMRREAEFVKNQRTIEGDWVDTVWYAALEEEYLGAEDDSSKTSSGDVERNDPATRV